MPDVRRTARVFVLDGASRVVLVQYRDDAGRAYWATPGGGLEAGEDAAAAAARELREEIGLADVPLVAVGEARVQYVHRGRRIVQDEAYFVARVPGVATELAAGAHVEGIEAVRAFTLEEIEASDAPIYPSDLVARVRAFAATAGEGRVEDRAAHGGSEATLESRRAPVVVVLAVVWRDERILLVQRAKPPRAGYWDFPGGRLEWGETIGAAATRELREETGVCAAPGAVLSPVELLEHDEARGTVRSHAVAVPVCCEWQSGAVHAADDALEAGWFAVEQLPTPLSSHVAGVLERSRSTG